MEKKRRNHKIGFTLIELLAVIVILAIIALIATPIILGIVEDARKDAFLRSVELVVSTTDIDIFNKTYSDSYTYTIEDGNISNLEIGIKNTAGMNGSITYDKQGNDEYAVHNGKWCVKKTSDMKKAEISDYIEGECIIVIPTSEKCFAFADGKITEYYDYEENDETKNACPKNVVIPEKINGEDVTVIGEYAFYEKELDSIVIPKTILEMEEEAFSYSKIKDVTILGNPYMDYSFSYNEIENLTFAEGVTEISDSGFYENYIDNIVFSSTVTYMGEYSFEYCSINNITISGNIETDMYEYDSFYGSNINSVTFTEGVTSIGNGAFYEMGLTNVNISNSVTSIGEYAFYGNQISSIKLPNSIESIEEGAFEYNNLSGELDLSMYPNLKSIDGFSYNEITSIKLPNSVESIGDYAFENNQLTSVTIPSSVTSIGEGAFTNNQLPDDQAFIYERNSDGSIDYTKLNSYGGARRENVVIPDGITHIGYAAFWYNQLTSVTIPNSVESIGYRAFAQNNLSGELDLSNTKLKSIGDYAFSENRHGSATNQITSIKLPNSVESIGNYAFMGNNLSGELDLSMYPNLKSVSGFGSNQITSVKLPNSVESIGEGVFSNNKLSGELDLSMYPNLKSIGDHAFYGSTNGKTNQITSIKLPNSVESIGNYAFAYNALSGELDLSMYPNLKSVSGFNYNEITSIKLPNSVESIGDYAFLYNKLSGELDLSNTNLKSIGKSAFQGSSDGSTNQISSIKFPNSIESIGNYAFRYNKLESVTFYGRSDLTGISIDSGDWTDSWAEGHNADNSIFFQP